MTKFQYLPAIKQKRDEWYTFFFVDIITHTCHEQHPSIFINMFFENTNAAEILYKLINVISLKS